MTFGCTPNLFQNKANTKPMGRVKWTSSHSSVSLDLNDACNNSLNVAIIWIYDLRFMIYGFTIYGFTIYGFTIYGFTIYEFTIYEFTDLRFGNEQAADGRTGLIATAREAGPVVEVDDVEMAFCIYDGIAAIDRDAN